MAEKKTQLAVLKKVLRRLRRYWPGLIFSMVLAALYVVMTLYIPILVGNAIDCIVDSGNVDFARMGIHLRNALLCAVVAGLAQWILTQINNRMTYHVTRDIREEAFRHIQVLPLSCLDQSGPISHLSPFWPMQSSLSVHYFQIFFSHLL